MIRFLLGDRELQLEAIAADTTLLNFLREDCARTGTKEGCASGDCGACTVVVATADDGGLHYAPVNACITPLGSVHGKQVITVEDLADGDALHPVQQALVDCHGSQCGFCTPGFVMSLFALYRQRAGEQPARDVILEALGGNLCRCTGYIPIVAAAERALRDATADAFSRGEADTRAALARISAGSESAASADAAPGGFLRPANSNALAQLLGAHPHARLVAGGTDLMLEVTQQLESLPVLIDVSAAADLHEMRVSDQFISVGAAVTHRAAAAAVLADYPELDELIERFGSLQIRSTGTVVGNIANASPIGDWPPVLIALGAVLTLKSASGERDLPLEEFFLDYRKTALAPGEFIRSVRIPRRPPHLFLRAYKISKRYEDDISSLCGVFALQTQGNEVRSARVAFGGMAAVVRRADGCEAALTARALDDAAIADAAAALSADFAPISDARASSGYRAAVAANLLRRLQLEFAGAASTRAHAVHHAGAAHG